jgi:probable HAF family extracellular repeat protein
MNRSVYVPLCSLLLLVALTGQTMGGEYGFLYSGGTFTTLEVPGSFSTAAYGINDMGQIVGGFSRAEEHSGELGLPSHAFLFTGGTFTTLDVPGSVSRTAYGINGTGQIVGSFSSSGLNLHGFFLTDEKFTTLDVPGGLRTQAFGINDAGHIVGSFELPLGTGGNGYLFREGAFMTLPIPAGSAFAQAFGINDTGQIVGNYFDSMGRLEGFVLAGGTFTTLHVPGSKQTRAYGINGTGQIVGDFQDTVGGDLMGFSTPRARSRRWMFPAVSLPKPTGSMIKARSWGVT